MQLPGPSVQAVVFYMKVMKKAALNGKDVIPGAALAEPRDLIAQENGNKIKNLPGEYSEGMRSVNSP